MRIWFLFILFVLTIMACAERYGRSVLIIMDERKQMEVLADFIETGSDYETAIVSQDSLPVNLASYRAVLVYIHHKLETAVENKMIEYTQSGGRLVLLHHSISSGKAENPHYFNFLGIRLDAPEKSPHPVLPGEGYGWVDPVTLTLVNLNPRHFITSNKIDWPDTVVYTSSDAPATEEYFPALKLEHSEAYLNHKFTDGRTKTVLCGIKFFDERNGELFMQDRGAWYKDHGDGRVFYFMAGHAENDFENKNYAQMILNALLWDD